MTDITLGKAISFTLHGAALKAGGAACCLCCLGGLVGRAIARRRKKEMRYELLSMAEESLESENSLEADEMFEEEDEEQLQPPPPEQDDLLDFSGRGGVAPVVTPSSCAGSELGSPAAAHSAARVSTVGSTTSAGWVDEMNAELAEFDALTAMAPGDASPSWKETMEAELDQHLQTPASSSAAR